MRDSGRDQLPPDVRFAGKPAEMRAPPWITVCPHQLLTETPSCEAGHVTAPDHAASSQKVLARAPSTVTQNRPTGDDYCRLSGKTFPAERRAPLMSAASTLLASSSPTNG